MQFVNRVWVVWYISTVFSFYGGCRLGECFWLAVLSDAQIQRWSEGEIERRLAHRVHARTDCNHGVSS